MSSASMFWQSVEEIGSGARDAALRHYLSESYEQIRPYLMPCPELTRHIACERTLEGHYCIYRIADMPEEDGTYAAMCDEHFCPIKFYTREELVRYTINLQILLPAIARCLGLHPQVRSVADRVWQVGQIPGAKAASLVLFTRVKDERWMQRVIESLILKACRSFVLVTPSTRYLSGPCLDLLAQASSQAFPLDEVTDLIGHEPVLTEAGRTRWRKMKTFMDGQAVTGVVFPTPAETRWSDLSLRFNDGYTLFARAGNTAMKLSFQDMGMEDKRSKGPNRQWKLLLAFAEGDGTLDWSSRHAHPRNQKQKELLAARLSQVFGIPGDPIVLQGQGWQTAFHISGY